MLHQIEILNQCLRSLQDTELTKVEKLKLEDRLFQLKRLLLIPEVEAMVKGDASSEKEFRDLYATLEQTNRTSG
jgi:hypothetical protein